MSGQLTFDTFAKCMPKAQRKNLTQGMVDAVNKLALDQEFREGYRDNLLSFASVLDNPRVRLEQYISAVRYASFKLLGSTNIVAYTKTFPDKVQKFIDDGVESKDIASYCTAYNKSMLVLKIMEQTMMPTCIVNADLYQKALNVQADLMMHAKSEKVRTDAANSLLVQLKMPDVKKIELDIGLKEDSSIDDLRKTTMELVAQQRQMIEAKAMSPKEIAHSKLVIEEAVFEEVGRG